VVFGVAYVVLVSMRFVEPPVAVVCDTGEPNVELSSTAARRGYFEQRQVGLCVLYTHHTRPVPLSSELDCRAVTVLHLYAAPQH
jgi:hypothetical protein